MRRTLVNKLIELDDKDTYFLTADVGYGLLEPLREKMGNRFINVGIAEQSMISIAAGLALSGKKVYTYTMCAFYLRTIEQIKLDLCYHKVPVTMIGVGPGFDYEQHGTTHFALEDEKIISSLFGIDVFTPKDKKELLELLNTKNIRPRYIRVSRFDELKTTQPILNEYPKFGGSLDYFNNLYKDED